MLWIVNQLEMLLFHLSLLLFCLPSALGAKGGAAGRNQVIVNHGEWIMDILYQQYGVRK